MKKTNTIIALWITAILLSVMVVSCTKGPTPPKPGVDPKEVFDFSMTKSLPLNVGLDVEQGYRVGLDVYTDNPFSIAEDGSLVKNNAIKPIDKGFTNEKGVYIHPVIVPTYAKQLYLYTNDAGVNPRLFVSKIENGVLGKAEPASYTGQPYASIKSISSKAAISENVVVGTEAIKLQKKHLLLSPWYQGSNAFGGTALFTNLLDGGRPVLIQGRPVNLSYANYAKFGSNSAPNNAMPISAEIWDKINNTLPGDNGPEVDPKFLTDGDIHVTKSDTELDLIFMDQRAAFKNTLAYYCYPTNNAPKSPEEIKFPVIAFANSSVQKGDDNVLGGDIAALYKGEGIKLKYVDEQGVMHDKFPAGTSVGWILYRNGFSSKLSLAGAGMRYTISEGAGVNYASTSLTNGKPNTAVLRIGDFVVLAFDDGTPDQTAIRDYLDLIFHVKASVKETITDPIPDASDPTPTTEIIEKSGTLAFEDLWPSQGDFDMNDLVVTYNSKITINKNNEVIETEDTFSLDWCGANYKNGFSYTVDGVSRANATVTFEGVTTANAKVDQAFGDLTIHLFDNISKNNTNNQPNKQSVTVKTTFNTPINKDAFKHAPYNAYIRIVDDKGSLNKETHLTNMKPINPDVAQWFGKSDDRSNPAQNLYFITFLKQDNNQQLPFAIHIPSTGNPATDKPFVISAEGVRISNYYPKFINWINTKGTQDADWYLHPVN